MATALLLAVGLSTAPAGAAVTSTAKGRPAAAAIPLALSTCLNGVNNSVNNSTVQFPGDEFYTWCKGSGPTSFRTIALCANGDAVLGVQYADGSGSLSYANCKTTSSLNSTLNPNPPNDPSAGPDLGILLCSNTNGNSAYQGYIDKSNDISWILFNWGNGDIQKGGLTFCNWNVANPTAINPNVPPA